jgi:hypothetical protein
VSSAQSGVSAHDTTNTDDVIELRVDNIDQLFRTLDPYPFRERDLDREAEEYIVGWARELAGGQPIKIVVHFPDNEPQAKAAQDLERPSIATFPIGLTFCRAI